MSKQRRQPIESRASLAVAIADDPSESGPPSEDEITQGDSDGSQSPSDAAADPGDGQAHPAASSPAEEIRQPPVPDMYAIIADLDRPQPAVWPSESPLTVNWPHSGEIDPQPGDILGWNWQRQEVAVVTAIPPVTEPWPYRLTVEIRPMPLHWHMVKVYNLNTGARLDVFWYTRWNRAYADASGQNVPAIGSGWLAVVQEEV